MRRIKREFTSESVCMGHPDKICDQISDAILDEIIGKDPTARVACETMVKTGMAIVAGEITTKTYVEIPDVVRRTIKEIGYTDAKMGFDYETCAVLTCIQKQSPDIAMGVDENTKHHKKLGAGDQGMMFGYACRETPELMPMPIMLSRKLVNRAAAVRQKGILKYLRPDGKSQITIDYENDHPVRINTVILSLQHNPEVSHAQIKKDAMKHIILPTLPKHLLDSKTRMLINPTGRFVVGGPQSDTGMTGRKIIVDTYGGMAPHGGGAFSGKDPTKVDRSACYMARYIAKNIVAAGLAEKCMVQLAYAIGVAEPVSIMVDTLGTGRIDGRLEKVVRKIFSLTPRGIIKSLELHKPIYQKTASYGHFGRQGFAWERTDKASELKASLK